MTAEPLQGPGMRLGSGFVAAWAQENKLGSAAAQETATAKLLGVMTANQEQVSADCEPQNVLLQLCGAW